MSAPDPLPCARCAAQGQTCCGIDPARCEFIFPLSETERERIRTACPELGEAFYAETPNTAGFLHFLKNMFPDERRRVAALFPAGGTHAHLAVDAAGNCALLGPRGCRLPRPARPCYCRLFPFWLSGGRLTVFASQDCLAQRENPEAGRLLAALGTDPAEVRAVMDDLRRAWGLGPGVTSASPKGMMI